MADEQHRSRPAFDAADEYRPEPPPPPEIPAWKDGSVRVGIHTSIAGDIAGALDIAHKLGANALQIFSSSPRMWDRGTSRISEADAMRFRAAPQRTGAGAAGNSRQLSDQSCVAGCGAADAVNYGVSSGDRARGRAGRRLSCVSSGERPRQQQGRSAIADDRDEPATSGRAG